MKCSQETLEYYRQLRSSRKESGLCVACGRTKERVEVTQCNSCSQKKENARKRRTEQRKVVGTCISCNGTRDSHYKLCLVCRNTRLTRYHGTKRRVIDYYGSVCSICKESRLGCLELDHVNNDGAQHRRDINGDPKYTTGTKLYQWLVDNQFQCKYELQVLCANCHALKHWVEIEDENKEEEIFKAA